MGKLVFGLILGRYFCPKKARKSIYCKELAGGGYYTSVKRMLFHTGLHPRRRFAFCGCYICNCFLVVLQYIGTVAVSVHFHKPHQTGKLVFRDAQLSKQGIRTNCQSAIIITRQADGA